MLFDQVQNVLGDQFDRLELIGIAVAHLVISSLLLNRKWDQACKAVVLMFCVAHVGVRHPARSCLALQIAWPNRHDTFRV